MSTMIEHTLVQVRSNLIELWCGLSANLGSRSETCCMWLNENTGCKKLPKIRHLRSIAQLCQAISDVRAVARLKHKYAANRG